MFARRIPVVLVLLPIAALAACDSGSESGADASAVTGLVVRPSVPVSSMEPSASAVAQNPVFDLMSHAGGALYDQREPIAGANVTSQNFEAAFDAFDSQGADDFVVPAGVSWKVDGVNVVGSFAAVAPPASVDVTFYADASGLPDAALSTCSYPGVTTGVDLADPSFAIELPAECSLSSGTYWVGVRANMDFSTSGQWFWSTTTQRGNPAAWQNPGGGFPEAPPCTTWGAVVTTCGFVTAGPDFSFGLDGTLVIQGEINGLIKPSGRGLVPVTILGGVSFDVTSVNPVTLSFGPSIALPSHDLTNPVTFADHLADVNLDGFTDLVTHYRQSDTGLAPGDTQACVTGRLLDGTRFEACGAVRIQDK